MNKPLQELSIPRSFKIIQHEFYTYNPAQEYSEKQNIHYLNEDLFQVLHKPSNLRIDLGWYGDTSLNIGQYTLFVIKNEDWENPITKIYAQSQTEMVNILNKTMQAINEEVIV